MKFKKHKIIRLRKKFFKKTFKRKPKIKLKIKKISFIILLLVIYLCFYYVLKNEKKIVIEVDLSLYKKKLDGLGGPIQLEKGVSKVLPYETKKCKFIESEGEIQPIPNTEKKNIDYFFFIFPRLKEDKFNLWKLYNRTKSLLLGPVFVPISWFAFPIKNHWKERKFREILTSVKAIVVHSNRVRDHLATRSHNTDLLNKFILFRSCTYMMPKNIKTFQERKIDIILYEKYADLKRHQQGKQLYELLNNTDKKIERLIYGNYKQDYEFYLAENSKFIIYFSFYDAGPIALKEIQNHGVITFALQKDIIISDKTGYYIPELEYDDIKPAFDKIINIINDVTKKNPDSINIANINQKYSNCERALDDICNGIINNNN